jgi:2-dehydro-3-deoxygluconokinase
MGDLVTFGETPLQFSPPDTERVETARDMQVYANGTESSTAIAASALGAESMWVSKLPDTPLGHRVAGELRRHDIETEIVWADSGTGRQGIVFRETGSPPRENTILHDQADTAFGTVTPGELPMGAIQDADGVFTGLSSAVLSEQAAKTAEAILRAAHGSGATTAVDIDYQPGLQDPDLYQGVLEPLLDHLDVLIGNEDEIRTVMDRGGQPRELANTIAADYDLKTVVITRSERGAVALQDTPGTNVMHERDTLDVDPVDSAGQHGAFDGGLLQPLVDDADLAEALSYAVGAATLARTLPDPLLTARRSEIENIVDEVSETSR